jgi:hypothetical protein
MNNFQILKKYTRAILIMGGFAAFILCLPIEKKAEYFYEAGSPFFIQQAFVETDIFGNAFPGKIEQLHGIRIDDQQTGKYAYYFEYVANKQDTLRRISTLPFLKDNRLSSTNCMLMESDSNPLIEKSIHSEVREATAFFWNTDADEFTFYECYKSPVKHTVLLSKTSDRILHKVEFM